MKNKAIKTIKIIAIILGISFITITQSYAENTTETVKVYDLVGNEVVANISINNIDFIIC